jgi:flagellar motility protein MotE (MotC chaperone)
LPSQDKSLISFEARKIQEELLKKLSRVTNKRHRGALVGLSVRCTRWTKSTEIAVFVDLSRSALGKGCNELCEVGISDIRVEPGTENQNKPTLQFKLKPEIPLPELISFLKEKEAYAIFTRPEYLEEVYSVLETNKTEYRKSSYATLTEQNGSTDSIYSNHDNSQQQSEISRENPRSYGASLGISSAQNCSSYTKNEMYYNNSDQALQVDYTQEKNDLEKSSDIDRFIEKLEELNQHRKKVEQLEQEICGMGKKAKEFISPLWSDQN